MMLAIVVLAISEIIVSEHLQISLSLPIPNAREYHYQINCVNWKNVSIKTD